MKGDHGWDGAEREMLLANRWAIFGRTKWGMCGVEGTRSRLRKKEVMDWEKVGAILGEEEGL